MSTNILRKAGIVERISCAHHVTGYYFSLCLTVRYRLTDGSQLSASEWLVLMRQATASFSLDHPALCSGIMNEGSQTPMFVRANRIDLNHHVVFERTSKTFPLSRLLIDLHSSRFSELDTHPGWRLVLSDDSITNSDSVSATFVAHHALIDGLSGLVFHRHLSRALDRILDGSEKRYTDDYLVPRINTELPLPLEEMIELPTTWQFRLRRELNKLRPQWLSYGNKNPYWTGNLITKDSMDHYRMHLRVISLGSDQSQYLRSRCHTHATSITGLLHALAASLLAELLPEAKSFLHHTPYSLRRWTGLETAEVMVNQTSDSCFAVTWEWLSQFRTSKDDRHDEDLIWALSACWSSALKDELRRAPLDNDVALLTNDKDWQQANLEAIGKRRPLTLEVSNVGSLEGQEANAPSPGCTKSLSSVDRKIKAERLTFSQSAMTTAAAITVSVATTEDGIDTVITWQDEAVDEDIVLSFCAGMDRKLRDLSHR